MPVNPAALLQPTRDKADRGAAPSRPLVTDGQTDRQTHRHTDRQTDTQTDRQTDRQL